MHTDRFQQLRKESLSNIFGKSKIISIWRKIVRNQLRQFDFKDLYDHYDFNYNIEDRATAIRNEILNGTYQVSLPLIYKLEKKFGVCRHIIIPQPIDALVLQVLVESISNQIIKHQPSKKSFYSRDKHNVGKPHDAAEYGLSISEQWKKLQKEIYKFNTEKKLLIVTDLSNYYDSININELKKVFLGYVDNNEVLVDILFHIIEEISWRPDYLPYSGRGLPTSNLEAIRLLAHSFLFEIDEVLKKRTKDSFTRWMDDIVIGIDSRDEAIEIISSISDMLKSRGLSINLSKTAIYNSQEANFHFQIDENKYLDSWKSLKKSCTCYNKITSEIMQSLKKHFHDKSPKYWDKVAKRYITTFTNLESDKLLPITPKVYIEHPSLRPNLLHYLLKLGYKGQTANIIIEILENINIFDDISLFKICLLITSWEIPENKESTEFLEEINNKLIIESFKRKKPADFYSVLWFKAKYNSSKELLEFIKKYQNLWQANSFLRRQVTAVMSRLLITDKEEILSLLYTQISSGIANTASLANQVQKFSKIDKIDGKLRFYLFPKNKQRPYPLPKFIVLCSVLNSEKN